MTKSRMFAVIKYEYLRNVKRAGFIISTIFFPLFMLVILAIQGIAATQAEEVFSKLPEEVKLVYVIDDTGLIKTDNLTPPLFSSDNLDEKVSEVKEGKADAVIYYPKTSTTNGKFQVFSKSTGLFGGISYGSLGTKLINENVVASIENEQIRTILKEVMFFPMNIQFDEKGDVIEDNVEKYIVPAISAIIFFLAVFISSQYLLQSVSEEKENRMIETILSIVSSKTLIWGKIIALSAVALTQILIWFGSVMLIYLAAKDSLGASAAINFSKVNLDTVPFNIYMTLMGFLLFAAIMVGVGAIATSYKDSQSLSSVFIIMAIFPMYLITYIIAEPNGVISLITSYFPMTAPMILLVRNSLGVLSPTETILSIIIVFIYVAIAFWFAQKMFDLGSLMYNRRPTVKEVWNVIKT